MRHETELAALAMLSLRLVDEGRAAEVPPLFASGGVLVMDGSRVEGDEALRARYEARASQRHVVSRHVLCDCASWRPGKWQGAHC